MAIYTKEQIEKFREHWRGKDGLISEIIGVLMNNGPANNAEDIRDRLEKVGALLMSNGWPSPDQTAKIPGIDLKGINFEARNCRQICLQNAHLEGAILRGTHLEGALLERAHLESADIREAHLEDAYLFCAELAGADLSSAHLEAARLYGAQLEGANLRRAHLEGAALFPIFLAGANLSHAHLEGAILNQAYLKGAIFSYAFLGSLRNSHFDPACTLPEAVKEQLSQSGHTTTFRDIDFLPRWRDHFFEQYQFTWVWKAFRKGNFQKAIYLNIRVRNRPRWESIFKHIFNRWFYTKFEGVRIDEADTVMAPDLYRYVKDQQYLYRFRHTHPWIYWIWKILSDCGGKLSVVGFWSALIVWLFSKIYPAANAIDPSTINALKSNLPDSWLWLFISFDIFSNLGIRNTTPQHPFGVVLMIAESVLGLMMLGMLISVLQNRFARRS